MATDDPNDPSFRLADWEAGLVQERRRRDAAKLARDEAWRQDFRTRLRQKDGTGLAPSYVSVPVPDPAPGAPRFRLVRQG